MVVEIGVDLFFSEYMPESAVARQRSRGNKEHHRTTMIMNYAKPPIMLIREVSKLLLPMRRKTNSPIPTWDLQRYLGREKWDLESSEETTDRESEVCFTPVDLEERERRPTFIHDLHLQESTMVDLQHGKNHQWKEIRANVDVKGVGVVKYPHSPIPTSSHFRSIIEIGATFTEAFKFLGIEGFYWNDLITWNTPNNPMIVCPPVTVTSCVSF